jgi:DNA-binding NtrC family response regulator
MIEMIGKSTAFLEMCKRINRLAACDAPVLIEGETGTGKELAARMLHYLGARRDKLFVPINCGAIPDLLIENELFGHRKGAFTDARDDQVGLIAHAHSGTLFLDEVDALSPKGQVVLLRFLQDRQYRPLGERWEKDADVQIIAASNTNLTRLAEAGQFRLDLLYRLKILWLELPPLWERKGDPELLADHFVRVGSRRFNRPVKTFHPATLEWFECHAWPGNVRELENWVYQELLLADGPEIRITLVNPCQPDQCPLLDQHSRALDDLVYCQAKAKAIESFEVKFLTNLMVQAKGNVTAAAKMAHTERRHLGKLLKKYSIDKGQCHDYSSC